MERLKPKQTILTVVLQKKSQTGLLGCSVTYLLPFVGFWAPII